jgi:predicted O-linked N-acetylglucosamine transferase (SPINDLY family)
MVLPRSWPQLFFCGERLQAETRLHAVVFLSGSSSACALERDLALFRRALGFDAADPASITAASDSQDLVALEQEYQASAADPVALRLLVERAPDYPDPLLLWATQHVFPTLTDRFTRRTALQRLGWLLLHQFPQRLDLLLALVAAEGATEVLRSLPEKSAPASCFYTHTPPAMQYLQSLWVKGRYSQLLSAYVHYQLQRRWFPSSDYMLRCYTMVGAIERVDRLFRAIAQRHRAELLPMTLSNMLFTALGLEQLDQDYVAQLVQQWRDLTRPPQLLPRRPLQVNERPVLCVVSADLRMHPVGRFWLPLAQALRQRFRLVHLGFNPHESDAVRDQLQQISDGWHLLDANDGDAIDGLLREQRPDLLLDLGGHTADNRPGLLNQRYAPVQATYLGFYGPSYAEQCDWWILDAAIARRVRHSYPGSEPIWELNGPSLCYDPLAHGLPAVEAIVYSEADHPVIGSFNHTRKLTAACIERFGLVLQAMPQAVLQFRSHSFYDPAVRRWFLQKFLDAGIEPHQLQPLPYAASGAEALNDYGRIQLHLDSYPVSGTTTTLDALAMGIPVLSGPNHLYAGAISAAILEQVGLAEMVCERQEELPTVAQRLCRQYASAKARRGLAAKVRNSAVCDTIEMPKMFAEQLGEMLRQASRRQGS